MRQLSAEELKRLYPPMTEEFSARMDRLIRGLPRKEGKPKMKKKMTVGFVLALMLLLITATALAASLGVFAQLANAHDPDDRLGDLDAVAALVQQTVTTDDGVTVTIDQAYYDGERIFISYQMTGDLVTVEKGHGNVEGAAWFNEEYGVAIDPDALGAQAVEAVQDGEEGDWVRLGTVSMHDGLYLQDGTYLDIIGGDERLLEDGALIGWKECEVPADRAAEVLSCKAVLFRGSALYQKHDGRLRASFERMDASTDMDAPFTVRKVTDVIRLTGKMETDVYTAQAECTLNGVDVKGSVTLRCPENWVTAWMDWDYVRDFDLIESWTLYSGDTRVSEGCNDLGVWGQGDTLRYEELLRHGGQTENLRLVPVYADSGEHGDEAIELKAE